MPRISATTVREHHDAQHEAILDVVGELLAEHGYEGIEFSAIGRRVGLARNSLYRYARDRDELLGQWLQRAFEPAMSSAVTLLTNERPAAERVATWLDAQLRSAASPRDGAATRLMAEFDRLPESVRQMVIEGHRPVRDALAGAVREALADQPDRDPLTALALLDGLVSAATRLAADGLNPRLHAETRNAVLSMLGRTPSYGGEAQ